MTIGPDGHPFPVAWRAAAGAAEVEVDTARLALVPDRGGVGTSLGGVTGAFDGTDLRVTIPGGPRLVRSLTLTGLQVERNGALVDVHDAGGLAGWRISVATVTGGELGAPVVTVPAVAARGAVPAQLSGGALAGRVLTLPDVRAGILAVSVVEGGTPEVFSARRFKVQEVTVRVAPQPEDVEVRGADGSPLWGVPGPMLEAATVDLRASLELALGAALQNGGAPATTFTAVAAKAGAVYTPGVQATGAVVRRFAERVEVELAGQAVPLPLAAPALDARSPASARADVTVRHHGVRLHPVSDSVPGGRGGGLAGPVVGGDAVLRVLPPGALVGEDVRRIAVVGRCAEPSDLSVRLVATDSRAPLGDPGVLTLDPSSATAAVWVELPEDVAVIGPVAVAVTATRGHFLWVATPEPVVLIAVAHPDPSGSTVTIAGRPFALTAQETTVIGGTFPPDRFQAGAAASAVSDQFCTVLLSELTLRYAP